MTACRQRQQWAALYRSSLLRVLVKSDAIGGLIECKRLVKCNANKWSVPMQSGDQVQCNFANITVRPSHLPNSRIKGDGVRVFLSERDHPYH